MKKKQDKPKQIPENTINNDQTTPPKRKRGRPTLDEAIKRKRALLKNIKRKPGRQPEYNPEVAARICGLVAKNILSVPQLMELNPDLPDAATVWGWLYKYPEFNEMYARAKESQQLVMAEEIARIAETPVIGRRITYKDTGTEIVEYDMIEHRKLQIETRKWLMAKLAPKKFGDRKIIQGDSDADPIQLSIAARLDAITSETPKLVDDRSRKAGFDGGPVIEGEFSRASNDEDDLAGGS